MAAGEPVGSRPVLRDMYRRAADRLRNPALQVDPAAGGVVEGAVVGGAVDAPQFLVGQVVAMVWS